MKPLRILIAEDYEQDLETFRETVEIYGEEKDRDIELVECTNLDEALKKLDDSFDGVIIDLKLANEGDEGNQIIKKIQESFSKIPIAIFTGNPSNSDDALNDRVLHLGVFRKGETRYEELLDRFWEIYNGGLTPIMGGRGTTSPDLTRVLLKNLPLQIQPRIEYLRVKNYRVLRDVELKNITPLSTFLGPNGSGKSTLIDVFAFLAECFTVGLPYAWDKRGRFKHVQSRGSNGPIEFRLKYREKPAKPLITYHLAIDEGSKGPFVDSEWLQWRPSNRGKPVRLLDFGNGIGSVIYDDVTENGNTQRDRHLLGDASMLAVSTLGKLGRHPHADALRRFITDWHLSFLSADATREEPKAGAQERLSETGDNLPNVIQYLNERHPKRLRKILSIMSKRVPRLEKVDAELMTDGRLLLQIKDAPFAQPILAKYVSDGTLKILSYLILLHDPEPARLIGIEEPENHLHPRLLPSLTEEFRMASSASQLIITTHSPYLVDEFYADEVWVLYRDEHGFTVFKRTADMRGINEFIKTGGKLGQLWMEGFFDCGDPLTNAGGPKG